MGDTDWRVDDLAGDDLANLAWSGDVLHLRSIATQLDRVALGEAEYLVARLPDGTPIAKAGIDYVRHPDIGWIWQVATHKEFEGRGLATLLMTACEARIVAHGRVAARLGVELDNPRARRLYDHLGYIEVGQERESWMTLDRDGREIEYVTTIAVMEKRFAPA